MTRKRQSPPNHIYNELLAAFAAGRTGTMRELAEHIGCQVESLRSTLARMEAAGRAQRIGEVPVESALRPGQPHAKCKAFVWGPDTPKEGAPRTPAKRSQADGIVGRALKAVEHLPQWLGGRL